MSPAREVIATEIERLIGLLDVIDGDCDLEDDGSAEPWLGWSKSMAHGTTDDREEDDDRELERGR
ncbi:hypothetical protein [Aureimonas psammosilenae]|uniref:hypothetical protein n=1 Tax=Aureimonas psammosilenae TaxID=2495496 RepID=UPI0012611602|nr:hypothetical protein [Aureimonas psammosilenae]